MERLFRTMPDVFWRFLPLGLLVIAVVISALVSVHAKSETVTVFFAGFLCGGMCVTGIVFGFFEVRQKPAPGLASATAFH